MRILVCGSRDWTDGLTIRDVLATFWSQGPTIVHGAARGADRIAADVADGLGFPTEAHPADWDRNGRGAGYLRNHEMVRSGIDRVIAFRCDGKSNGTDSTIHMAEKLGIRVTVITPREDSHA